MKPSVLGRGGTDPSRHAVGGAADGADADPELVDWRRFAEATTAKSFCQSWLPLQCGMLKGVRCGMILLGEPDRGPFSPVAVWPDASISMHHLTGAAERAIKERRGLLIAGDTPSRPESLVAERHHIAYPILVGDEIHGVVVLETKMLPSDEITVVMRQLHWGAAWLEVMIRRTEGMKSREVNERLQRALDWVTSAAEHERFHEAAMAFVTRLATTLECDRVSLGFATSRQVQVKVISHSATFGKGTNLARAIGAAMDEAIDQRTLVVYPLPPEAVPSVIRAHEELSRQHGSGAILTIPLENKGRLLGALTLERPADNPFDAGTIEVCQTAAVLAGTILDSKRTEDRWIIRKVVDSLAGQLRKVLGPGHLLRKLILILLLGLVIFFSFFMVDYRVTATTAIEGAVQRVVAAPFNGFVKEAAVRAGDVVSEGDVLCLLDDRDLRLERLKWVTEKEQLLRQYHEAMSLHDRAQIRIVKAKMNQAEAQISLLDEQLARTKLIAPFDGVVMSGDLSQSLGAPVERGQVIFEVAPLEQYRVIAEVDERDILEIHVGQQSELMLPSMSGEVFPFVVEKITPVSTAEEGRNYFRVEGRLEEDSSRLRPGMEGVGKISVDRRKLIWVWTHEAVDWLRLKFWNWLP